MDNNQYNDYDNTNENLENENKLRPVEPPGDPSDGDYGKTMEMDSLRVNQPEEPRGITPREEFTDLNSTGDMSRTLLMDSVDNKSSFDEDDFIPVRNPVKKRRRKKKQINHTRTMAQIFLGVVISVVAICAGSLLAVQVVAGLRDITGMAKAQKEFDLSITESTTIDEIADTLEANGIILKSSFFKTYLKHDKSTGDILVGTHTLQSNMSYGKMVTTLKTPKQYIKTTTTIMFPEGITAAEVGRLLEEHQVCRASDFEKIYRSKHTNIKEAYDFEEGIEDDPLRFNVLEGYLWPDTYEFYVIDDLENYPTMDTTPYAKAAADKMFSTFRTKITKTMKAKMEELGMTLDEVIILASIIQHEGNAPDNMAVISSVFHNRLNNPEEFPKLQSDAIDLYLDNVIEPGLKDDPEKYQAVYNAYNTYICDGLPAGAICNPGLDAIKAAISPDSTNYYYFIVDRKGEFHYAKTLEEHEKNIQLAQLQDQQ